MLKLGVPCGWRLSLATTHPIESAVSVTPRAIARVTRWPDGEHEEAVVRGRLTPGCEHVSPAEGPPRQWQHF